MGEQAEFAGTHRFIGEGQIRLDTMEDTLTISKLVSLQLIKAQNKF